MANNLFQEEKQILAKYFRANTLNVFCHLEANEKYYITVWGNTNFTTLLLHTSIIS